MQPTVILVEPSVAGNVGAVARLMANFGVEDLVLINPNCDYLCKEAMDRAKHARPLLKKARIADWKVLKEQGNCGCVALRFYKQFFVASLQHRLPDQR